MPIRRNPVAFQIRGRLHGTRFAIATGTRHEDLALAYERTVNQLLDAGCTDIVRDLVTRTRRLSVVHEAVVTGGVTGIRDRLLTQEREVDLTPTIAQWQDALRAAGRPSEDSILRYGKAIGAFKIARGSLLPNDLTPSHISLWLQGRSGRRRALVAMSRWTQWLRSRDLITNNPVDGIAAPAPGKARELFVPSGKVSELLLRIPQPARDAVALAYGAGIEASPLVALTGADFNPAERAAYVAGTKTRHRARWVRVADWCWPTCERLLTEHGTGPLFPGMSRYAVSDAHRLAVTALGYKGVRLHDARRTFAVRLVQAGVPFSVVADQLGHADAGMVMKVYGKYRPNLTELDRWERVASGQG